MLSREPWGAAQVAEKLGMPSQVAISKGVVQFSELFSFLLLVYDRSVGVRIERRKRGSSAGGEVGAQRARIACRRWGSCAGGEDPVQEVRIERRRLG